MTDRPATLGVVLAGGLARRMGGGDKALRTLGGQTLLERVIARMAPQCDGLVLSANGDPARLAAFGPPVIADSVSDFPGPLAGILSALDWAAAHRPDVRWLVSVAADCPFLPHDLVTRLHQARAANDAEIATAVSGGQVHHVISLWSIDLRDAMRHALVAENMRSVHRWTARYTVAIAEWPVAPHDPFFNVNTTEDLEAAERLIAAQP
ncbi:MAG: molybdenum cofactor guanylyltransferase MobA [Afipia sp.]|jgi:molybdopterin-guanine dinucleotide biosynthesis protein A|nr:molybdenum cofactor guanylyltransferase MobA [Afipia sp.]